MEFQNLSQDDLKLLIIDICILNNCGTDVSKTLLKEEIRLKQKSFDKPYIILVLKSITKFLLSKPNIICSKILSLNMTTFTLQDQHYDQTYLEKEIQQSPEHHFHNQNTNNAIHRSAPLFNLDSNLDFIQNQQDFIFNSCTNHNEYYQGQINYNDKEQLVSQFSNDQDLYQQGHDIFQRIQGLGFNTFDDSLLQEDEKNVFYNLQVDEERNQPCQFLELNLNISSSKSKLSHKYGDYHTDRVFSEPNENQKLNQSFQKNKNYPNNTLFQSENFQSYLVKPNNAKIFNKIKNSNSKKYQTFTSYLKESNILAEIMPSNNIDDSFFKQKSVISSIKESENSQFLNQCTNLANNLGNKQKLFKKIDLFISSNTKRSNKGFVKKQRNQNSVKPKKPLLVKDHTISQVEKENKLTRKMETHSKQTKGNKENTEISMFKRSSNKNLNELTRQRKINRVQPKNHQLSNKKEGLNHKSKDFEYVELTSLALNELSHSFQPKAYEYFVELNKIYLFSVNQIDKIRKNELQNEPIAKPKSQGLQFCLKHSCKLDQRIQNISHVKNKQLSSIKQQLQKTKQSLNENLIIQEGSQVKRQEYEEKLNLTDLTSNKNIVNLNPKLTVFRIIHEKRKQLVKSFNFLEQMNYFT